MDLKTSVVEAFDRVVSSGAIEREIEAQLAKTIKDVIYNCLKPYSPFGKELEQKVQQSLMIHGELDLPSYNDAVLKIVRRQLSALTSDALEHQIAERLGDLLQPPPESIKLSELIEQFRKRNGESEDDAHEITFHRKDRDLFTDIALDGTPHKDVAACEIRFGVFQGKIYHMAIRGVDTDRYVFAGPFYDFHRSLFQMKCAGTRIELDVCSA